MGCEHFDMSRRSIGQRQQYAQLPTAFGDSSNRSEQQWHIPKQLATDGQRRRIKLGVDLAAYLTLECCTSDLRRSLIKIGRERPIFIKQNKI